MSLSLTGRTYRGGHKCSEVQTCYLKKGCLSVGPRDGGGGTYRDAGDSSELSSQQSSSPSLRHDILADMLGSPVSLGLVLVSLWPLVPATPPQQTGEVGAPIHQFLEIPLLVASCSMSLLFKILPCSANKKRGCLFCC